MKLKYRLTAIILANAFVNPIYAQTVEINATELANLKAQILALQNRLSQLEEQADASTSQLASNADTKAELASQEGSDTILESKDGITVGGAIRTNYSYTSYDEGNKNRGGDFDFDIFRLNLSGTIGDVSLNGEIRFFDYMTAIKYAYVGYQISENWQTEVGITKVPFGNSPYNSQNYFFSTNYYLGLEDDFDLGVVFKRTLADNWQLDLGFFKNDELGGVDGYVDNRSDRYSYDIVGGRPLGEGIYDEPTQAIGEYNTFSGRFAYHFDQGALSTEVGVSGLYGGLHDGTKRVGDYQAWALHTNSQYHNWHLQLQQSQYRYDIAQLDRIAVGAYSFYDSIAAEATSTTVNLAYDLAVNFGPVTALQFYNNYGVVYNKSDNTANTVMNVTGFSVAAGGLFTYFDWVHAKNQPFVGGSGSGDSNDYEQRFNINIGYYF
ncbi:MAG TPA: carbohydrate porin [Methylophaga sp.]|nr:carbohydrate porin [Methylophaga sp.]